MDYYDYLKYGGNHKVDGTNDAQDFQDTLKGNLTDVISVKLYDIKLFIVPSSFKCHGNEGQ